MHGCSRVINPHRKWDQGFEECIRGSKLTGLERAPNLMGHGSGPAGSGRVGSGRVGSGQEAWNPRGMGRDTRTLSDPREKVQPVESPGKTCPTIKVNVGGRGF